jgi:2-dehydropantoate 2-reductase
MIPDRPVIAIIGAGAIGGYYGARLAQHGHDVHFLLRSDYASVKANGLRIFSRDGDFELPASSLHVYDDVRKMPRADLVIICLKATSNHLLPELITPLLHESTALLTLQNGLGNEELLAQLFGQERVIGGLAFVCINRGESGVIHHMDHGQIRIGELGRPITPRLQRISEMFNSSRVRCEMLEDLRVGRWTKLVWNIPFNGLGTIMNAETDKLIATDAGTGLVREIMTEVVAGACACGVNLPKGLVEQQIERTRSMGAYRTSMQIDRQLGRPIEVEAIFGEPLKAASKAGVEMPLVRTIYRMLQVLSGA